MRVLHVYGQIFLELQTCLHLARDISNSRVGLFRKLPMLILCTTIADQRQSRSINSRCGVVLTSEKLPIVAVKH
jgi:hypothetical protein